MDRLFDSAARSARRNSNMDTNLITYHGGIAHPTNESYECSICVECKKRFDVAMEDGTIDNWLKDEHI